MNNWVAFVMGCCVGGVLAWLWLRTRVVELRAELNAAKQAAGQAADAGLQSNQNAFLEAARSTLENKHLAIEGVVKPLTDSLGRLESQVRELERDRQRAFGGLGQQIQALAHETANLSTALRSPQTRGRWGEITLRRVAELSGMIRNCDFLEQRTFDGAPEDGARIRPDMLVRLPGGRSLVVDAKVPLSAYLDAVAATEEPARQAALQRHAQQVSGHVRQLSGKRYWSQFQPAPELVLLFLPGDHFFSAALECNPGLIEEALAQKVVIATPVTLISVLKGIAYGWNQQQLAENAERIRQVASEFCGRLQTVSEHYADTGRQIEKAVECFNRSVASWDSRLLPSLRKLHELGISESAEPAAPERIDVAIRRPRAVGG